MKECTVTFYLNPEQEAAMKAIADERNCSIEDEFSSMMLTGSRLDIDQKIKIWKQLRESDRKR